MNCSDIRLCIITPNRPSYSETFIQAHIERLPARKLVLYGTSTDNLRDQDDQPLTPVFTLWRHLQQSIARRVYRRSWQDIAEKPFLQYLQRNKINAVLAEYGPTGVAVMRACHRLGIPLIVQFLGFDAYAHATLTGVGRYYQALFSQASATIAVSRHMEQQLLSLGAPREKLHYNFCGVDVNRFTGADPSQAPPRFVAIGRFTDKKAPLLTLLAFRQVQETIPDATLVMVGDGPLWEASMQLADQLGIAQAVKFLGPLPHEKLPAIMQNARAFVQHSVRTRSGDSEGTPVIVLEASATGLPVISTRHGGILDVVVDGVTGFLVDEGDVDGMAAAMVHLARNPALAAQLGQAAKARMRAEFSIEQSIETLMRIILDSVARDKDHLHSWQPARRDCQCKL